MFCILAIPLAGVIRNINILLADILLIFIISLYKGVPPQPAPSALAVDQCHERILSPDKNFSGVFNSRRNP